MLNGTDAQSLGKDVHHQHHHHHQHHLHRDLVQEFRMGVQVQDPARMGVQVQDPARFYHHQDGQDDPAGCAGYPQYPPSLSGCPRTAPGQSYFSEGFSTTTTTTSPEGPYVGSFQPGYPLYPLPGLQVCGKTRALLNNYPLWAKFHKFHTEMIITKQGRRMFPFLSFNISILDPSAHYNVYVDVVLADQHHWRYQGGKWVQCGKAEGNMPGNRMYMHPDSPNTGAHWMRQEVSFGKLKLTNNKGSTNNVAQMIVLQSLHKYQPRLHIVEVKEDGSEEPFLSDKAQTFLFPETQFIAVTAYQNADITQLKIDHNPFAKGFRDSYDTLYAPPDSDRLTPSPTEGQQLLPGSCYPQGYLSEQYVSPLPPSRFYTPIGVGQQPKDPASSPGPHSRWCLSPQQNVAPGRLDFTSSYEGDFSGNGFYKPFPLQNSTHQHHHALGYYPDHPFASASGVSVSGAAAAAGWSAGRPSPQYLTHPGKSGPSLGWFRPVSSTSATSPGNGRLHPSSSSSLLESLRPALLQDRPKEAGGGGAAGEDPWLEPASVKSVDSADSGLFEGGLSGEGKKRRMSPYTSSTENSPPTRGGEVCEKDSSSDAGYFGFYTH